MWYRPRHNSGSPGFAHSGFTLLLPCFPVFEHLQSFVACNSISNVSKCCCANQLLLRRSIPDWLVRMDSHIASKGSKCSMLRTGVKSTMSFHSGFLRDLAKRSQSALFTAPEAMWMTPFSGPILFYIEQSPLILAII